MKKTLIIILAILTLTACAGNDNARLAQIGQAAIDNGLCDLDTGECVEF